MCVDMCVDMCSMAFVSVAPLILSANESAIEWPSLVGVPAIFGASSDLLPPPCLDKCLHRCVADLCLDVCLHICLTDICLDGWFPHVGMESTIITNIVANAIANPIATAVANAIANTFANTFANTIANTIANAITNAIANAIVSGCARALR